MSSPQDRDKGVVGQVPAIPSMVETAKAAGFTHISELVAAELERLEQLRNEDS